MSLIYSFVKKLALKYFSQESVPYWPLFETLDFGAKYDLQISPSKKCL